MEDVPAVRWPIGHNASAVSIPMVFFANTWKRGSSRQPESSKMRMPPSHGRRPSSTSPGGAASRRCDWRSRRSGAIPACPLRRPRRGSPVDDGCRTRRGSCARHRCGCCPGWPAAARGCARPRRRAGTGALQRPAGGSLRWSGRAAAPVAKQPVAGPPAVARDAAVRDAAVRPVAVRPMAARTVAGRLVAGQQVAAGPPVARRPRPAGASRREERCRRAGRRAGSARRLATRP